MKNLSLIIAIIICWINSLVAQQQTPAWLFPIMFKDGNGERDTIYIGYDKNATSGLDTIYGEKYVKVDTSKFIVSFTWIFPSMDSTLQTIIRDSLFFTVNNPIYFHKGKMPLTMYWYDTLFYSDSLPFPDLSPKPRARGDVACINVDPQYMYCLNDAPSVYMTNMKDSLPITVQQWAYSDSVVFPGNSSFPGIHLTGTMIKIVPFDANPSFGGINDANEDDFIQIYPNPSSQELRIKLKKYKINNLEITNILGELIMNKTVDKKQEEKIIVDNLPEGFYILKIVVANNSRIFYRRFTKIN